MSADGATPGRLTRIDHPDGGTTEICYDEVGRRSSMLEPDGTLTTYRWNDLDRIVGITRSTADARTWRLTVEHDAFGLLRRVDAGDVVIRGRSVEIQGLTLLGERAIAVVVAPPLTVMATPGATLRLPRRTCPDRPPRPSFLRAARWT